MSCQVWQDPNKKWEAFSALLDILALAVIGVAAITTGFQAFSLPGEWKWAAVLGAGFFICAAYDFVYLFKQQPPYGNIHTCIFLLGELAQIGFVVILAWKGNASIMCDALRKLWKEAPCAGEVAKWVIIFIWVLIVAVQGFTCYRVSSCAGGGGGQQQQSYELRKSSRRSSNRKSRSNQSSRSSRRQQQQGEDSGDSASDGDEKQGSMSYEVGRSSRKNRQQRSRREQGRYESSQRQESDGAGGAYDAPLKRGRSASNASAGAGGYRSQNEDLEMGRARERSRSRSRSRSSL